ncbi:hypothetical protein [Methylosinus sp. LW4]|uniref:hypothetical protein n=1 Tax=Methylosinus sp. LW4 TaxID=136993 RepID=UPI00036B0778|nr:hypothetical protein [Methylosinus sp. LW4]
MSSPKPSASSKDAAARGSRRARKPAPRRSTARDKLAEARALAERALHDGAAAALKAGFAAERIEELEKALASKISTIDMLRQRLAATQESLRQQERETELLHRVIVETAISHHASAETLRAAERARAIDLAIRPSVTMVAIGDAEKEPRS